MRSSLEDERATHSPRDGFLEDTERPVYERYVRMSPYLELPSHSIQLRCRNSVGALRARGIPTTSPQYLCASVVNLSLLWDATGKFLRERIS